eukprot:6191523-Pleurochrysis_carterae.AAC.1
MLFEDQGILTLPTTLRKSICFLAWLGLREECGPTLSKGCPVAPQAAIALFALSHGDALVISPATSTTACRRHKLTHDACNKALFNHVFSVIGEYSVHVLVQYNLRRRHKLWSSALWNVVHKSTLHPAQPAAACMMQL